MTNILSTLNSIVSALFGTGGVVPTFFSWLTSEEVVIYWILGIAISLILLGVRVVKSIFWGA